MLVQRIEQAAFADDKRGAVGLLLFEKPRGGHGAGEDVLGFDVDAHAIQFGDDVAAGALAVVGQETKRDVASAQLGDEPIRARDHFRAAVENAIHVDQVSVLHR